VVTIRQLDVGKAAIRSSLEQLAAATKHRRAARSTPRTLAWSRSELDVGKAAMRSSPEQLAAANLGDFDRSFDEQRAARRWRGHRPTARRRQSGDAIVAGTARGGNLGDFNRSRDEQLAARRVAAWSRSDSS
jgi:hypothetical protein